MMQKHRFYVSPHLISQQQVLFSQAQARQMKNVLRLQVGDIVYVFDGSGNEYATEIQTLDSKQATGRITHVTCPETEPRLRLTLVQGLPKGDKIDFILQKCTEIGVSSFLIVTTSRSVPRIPKEKQAQRIERWQAIVREAAEQSGRVYLPKVCGIVSFDEALSSFSGRGLIGWEGEKVKTLLSEIGNISLSADITCFIGPEGGFTDEEIDAAIRHGVTPVSLGARVLRAETAAIVASVLLIYGAENPLVGRNSLTSGES
jgi:16S rRNA (uracil1498-N3)-methyltransferase